MASMLLYNIGNLLGLLPEGKNILIGEEMATVNSMKNAWLLLENNIIADYGLMEKGFPDCDNRLNIEGDWIMPAFCDAHTHIVFAQTREEEFEMKISGKTYEEIAAAGGGILNSAEKLAVTNEDDLYNRALKRLAECVQTGTGAIEVKSGYGLNVEAEMKMLRVVKRLKNNSSFPVIMKSNLLAAHALPNEFTSNRNDFIEMVVQELIPKAAADNLADFVDVFCEKGFFTPDETDRILKEGAKYGFKAKIHANQLSVSGGVQVGVKNNAVSVDHLEEITDTEIEVLRQSNTIPCALPGCSFYLGIPFAPAKKIIKSTLPLALASDYNPGSSPSGNMFFIWSLGCIKMKMTPAEAFNAVTINGAAAMDVANLVGSITKGKIANLLWLESQTSLAAIPYAFGKNPLKKVFLKGNIVA